MEEITKQICQIAQGDDKEITDELVTISDKYNNNHCFNLKAYEKSHLIDHNQYIVSLEKIGKNADCIQIKIPFNDMTKIIKPNILPLIRKYIALSSQPYVKNVLKKIDQMLMDDILKTDLTTYKI